MCAFNNEAATVAIDDVFDDGQSQPGAAHGARAARVDTVKAFGQARNYLKGDAVALVAHRDDDASPADVGNARRRAGLNGDLGAFVTVLDGVVDKIGEDFD